MLKVLIRKQLTEIFRGFFTDRRKNTARSKRATIVSFVGFAFLMLFVVGGMFLQMARTLCAPLAAENLLWLYYTVMGLLSVFLGAFGSVFSTYAGLYLAKDNDLLLSMPIPVHMILASRLLTVYLMGFLYSALVSVPAVLTAWANGFTAIPEVIGSLVWVFLLSVVVLVLSCLLGWVVAKISVKLKNQSFITVLISLAFLIVYYFCYFKAQQWIQTLIANAAAYGMRLKGAAYGLYWFGRAAEGAWLPLLGAIAAVSVLFALTYFVLSRSFLRIVTASAVVGKRKYKEKTAKRRSVSRALLSRELLRFTASPNYMINCGLSILLLPAAGIALLWKGTALFSALAQSPIARPGMAGAVLCAALCMLASMGDMAAPSVSLEGKTLWLVQSLPVTPRQILSAKLRMQLLLTGVPMLFFAVCAAIVLPERFPSRILLIGFSMAVVFLSAVFDLSVGLQWHNLSWTNEITPIKQSAAVAAALFGMWGYAILMGGLYFLVGYRIGLTLYLTAITLLTLISAGLLYYWICRKGTKIFAAL